MSSAFASVPCRRSAARSVPAVLAASLACLLLPRLASATDRCLFGAQPLPTTCPGDTGPGAVRSPSRVPPGLVLVWQDVQGLLGEDFAPMASEVGAIFRSIGVEVSWRIGGVAEGGPATTPVEVQVVLLASHPSPARAQSTVMGESLMRQRSPRTAWVYLDSVERALRWQTKSAAERLPAERRQLALALGRVAAHEVVHAIDADLPHSREGLMRSAMDRTRLLGSSLAWDTASAHAVLTRLAGLPPAAGRAEGGVRTVRAGPP